MAAEYGHTKATFLEAMLQLRARAGRRSEIREARRRRSSRSSASGSPGYRHDQPAYSLSYANRRRLEIARAMATNARLLLLDEPAARDEPARDARDHGADRRSCATRPATRSS